MSRGRKIKSLHTIRILRSVLCDGERKAGLGLPDPGPANRQWVSIDKGRCNECGNCIKITDPA